MNTKELIDVLIADFETIVNSGVKLEVAEVQAYATLVLARSSIIVRP